MIDSLGQVYSISNVSDYSTTTDTLRSLSHVRILGEIRDLGNCSGCYDIVDFSGTMYATVFDKASILQH